MLISLLKCSGWVEQLLKCHGFTKSIPPTSLRSASKNDVWLYFCSLVWGCCFLQTEVELINWLILQLFALAKQIAFIFYVECWNKMFCKCLFGSSIWCASVWECFKYFVHIRTWIVEEQRTLLGVIGNSERREKSYQAFSHTFPISHRQSQCLHAH